MKKVLSFIFVSLLFPHTQKAVDDFYGNYLKEIPGADPNLDRIIEVVPEKFEHIESSTILPQIYPDIIKKWPPGM